MEIKKKPECRINLSAAMKQVHLNKTEIKPSWVFKDIPNVGAFEISLGKLDKLFLKYDIHKKIQPIINIEPYRNKSMNRYKNHQLERLIKQKGNPEKYFKLGMLIIKSNTFIITAINHIFPQWHRKMGIKEIHSAIKEYKRIITTQDTSLDYRRGYVPKKDSYRPLGIPTPGWRLYLHNINNILMIYLYEKISSSQHGFQPRRGAMTAWNEILNKVIDAKDIWEFDLKLFFDQVSLIKIKKSLIRYGVPKWMAEHLDEINRSEIKLKDERKLDESQVERKNSEIKWTNQFKKHLKNEKSKIAEQEVKPILKVAKLMYNMMFGKSVKGVPQGSPTSPLLAMLTLEETVLKRFATVMYADDGIHYGDLPENIIEEPKIYSKYGIEHSPLKCHWIKKDGKWLKPLKFLGTELEAVNNGETFKMKAATRNGSTLEVESKQIDLWEEYEARDRDPYYEMRDTEYWKGKFQWENWMKSKIAGFYTSRMNIGKWDLENFQQDFTYNYQWNSWSAKYSNYRNIDIFNSSSIACRSLLNCLRRQKRYDVLKKFPRNECKIKHYWVS